MRIKFLSLFGDFDIADLCDKTGAEILLALGNVTQKDTSLFHLFFQGNVIDNNSKPSDFGATDGDDLICFVDVVINENVSDKCSSSIRSAADLNIRLFQNMNLITPINNQKPTPKPTQNQIVPPRPHQETDAEYASRIIAEGKYIGPLIEVHDHNCLERLFLNTLRNHDQRLYQYLNNNHNAFMEFIRNAPNNRSNVNPAFTLIDDARNNDIMNIIEILNIDYDEALNQYLQADMSLDTWSQRFF